jgi:nicotinamidase-related amidase
MLAAIGGLGVFGGLVAAIGLDAAARTADRAPLEVTARSRVANAGGVGKSAFALRETKTTLDPRKTAVVIVDMWDHHWCRGAEARVAEMAPTMNKVVGELRDRGALVIHAPSTCVDFYKDTPQRKRAIAAPYAKTPIELSKTERWGTAWCYPDDAHEGKFPIDDSDMGCDCQARGAEKPCQINAPWTRQIASIEIAAADAITDNGQQTYNLLKQHGIENVVIMGVHLNMCVLGRPFGIRQLTRLGQKVYLVRDLTDTMYNSKMSPKVNHFDGTDLVVEHVEKYWCPSVLSTDLASAKATGGKPFRFREDTRKP